MNSKPSLVLPNLNPTNNNNNNQPSSPPPTTTTTTSSSASASSSRPASKRPPLTIASVSSTSRNRNLSVSSQLSHHRSQHSISSSIGHEQQTHSPSSTTNRSIVGASLYPTTLPSTFDDEDGKLNDHQQIIHDIQAAMNGISSTTLNSISTPSNNIIRARSGSSASIIKPISVRRPRTAENLINNNKSSNSLTVPSSSTPDNQSLLSSSTTTKTAAATTTATTNGTSHHPTENSNQTIINDQGTQSSELHDQAETEEAAFDEIEFEPSDLEILNSLGEGAGGEVRKVLHRPSGLYMAKKTIPTSPNPSLHRQILRELAFNREVADGQSPSIVKYYGAFLEENNTQIAILMEYCEGGSLEAIYKRIKQRKGRIGEKILGKVAESVLGGLSYLHTRRIIHRDIKPSNILVSKEGLIKICDLGVSGELIGSMAGTFMGTSAYMAPERIRGETYSITSDVWSLGLTLLELAMNRFPLVNINEDGVAVPLQPFELLQTVVTFEMPSMNEEEGIVWTKSLQHFIKTCLDKNPNQRPGPKALLEQHPWIAKSRSWTPDVKTWLIKVWDW
ncbi:Protein kinase C signaling pathway involved MAPKK protein [Puccinia graminis f. sp. tritici]|uniref:Protein kinase C signaling pathway involved MAPKK protein n=1 Tax=Puccinia graminis f. sp. tritici TaxID=56615 RepID=A0A5B0REQ1_PUCGR|nr:Protein kinase C signaling pathway involved MAPKK protein [Puccinia graminis f. sp. tritici]KAA1123443.1 Protein kinase C signaling pathway involved MAPKK protein [Puccinia graminis f. sp. tritici]